MTLERKAGLRRTGTARKNTSPGVSALRILARRSDGLCELAECGAVAVHTHHRRPRGMGGSGDYLTNLPANLLRLCLQCHEHIERNRANAYAFGLLVHQGVDPATVPVVTRHASLLVLLDNYGGWAVEAEFIPAVETEGGEDW